MKPDVVDEPPTLPQFGWLMKLKISARNWIFCVPVIRKFLKNAMSHCCSPGLRKKLGFRGALPKVPAVGAANAAGLNQKFWSFAEPAENWPLALLVVSPTKLYGWPKLPSPTPAMSFVRTTENGVPVRKKLAPE